MEEVNYVQHAPFQNENLQTLARERVSLRALSLNFLLAAHQRI